MACIFILILWYNLNNRGVTWVWMLAPIVLQVTPCSDIYNANIRGGRFYDILKQTQGKENS